MEDNKKNVMMAGRVDQDTKDYVDNMYKDIPGETYASAMRKLIECYSSRPVDEDNGLDFALDIEAIEKSLKNVKNIMSGIKGKADDYVAAKVRETNEKLLKKNEVMENFKEAVETRVSEFEKEIEDLKEKNKDLIQDKEALSSDLQLSIDENAQWAVDMKQKDDVLERVNAENKKLNLEVSGYLELISELRKECEELRMLKDVNSALEKDISTKNESIRDLEHKVSIKENEIEFNKDTINGLSKSLDESKVMLTKTMDELTKIKDVNIKQSIELTSVNNELTDRRKEVDEMKKSLENANTQLVEARESHRNEISKITIESKEELLNIKEQVRADITSKYEDKIEKLKSKYEKEILALKETLLKNSQVKETSKAKKS